MTRTYAIQSPELVGQHISVSGWVNSRRDHGGLKYNDVRDHTGIVQLVINPETPEAFAVAEQHRIAMESSADPAAYDYSAGWPAVYGEQ